MKISALVRIFIVILLFSMLTGCQDQPCDDCSISNDLFNITLENEDGSVYHSFTDVLGGTTIDLPSVEKDGYVFSGWRENEQVFYQTLEVTHDITLKASFVAIDDLFALSKNDTDMTATITSYLSDVAYLKIPNRIDGYLIIGIGVHAFDGSSLIEVEIPRSVSLVDYYAFANCKALTKVSYYGNYEGLMETTLAPTQYDELIAANPNTCNIIEGSVEEGSWTFVTGCPISEVKSVTSVTISGNTYTTYHVVMDLAYHSEVNYMSIGMYAFMNDTALTEVNLPSRLTFLDPFQFDETPNLLNIVFDEDETRYVSVDHVVYSNDMSQIIYYPSGLTNESYVTPESVTEISFFAFLGASHLKSITILDQVTYISPMAFVKMDALESFDVSLGNLDYYSSEGVLFASNHDLLKYPASKSGTSFIVSDETTEIMPYAFSENKYLEEIDLGQMIASIGDHAFVSAQKLISIDIPSSVENLGPYVFIDSSIEQVIIHRSVIIDGSITRLDSRNYYDGAPIVYVPDDSYDAYLTSRSWISSGLEILRISDLTN